MTAFSSKKKILLSTLLAFLVLLVVYLVSGNDHSGKFQALFRIDQEINFNEQIRPIFNAKCIACHGGVKQSGGFSLLFEEEALRPNESGKPAIIPGKPQKSELINRITHHDPEMRMPLEEEPLSEDEIELLTEWIDQGAQWEDHWAFKKPEPQVVPDLSSDWVKNDIDQFILKKLHENELQPSPRAAKATLLRRVSLDLTGLPPTPSALENFLEDNSPDAYERVVDKLLASPQYGERWTSMWMDIARYADTKGYEKDTYRNIWQYRDWLIKAFNNDKPYDEFIIEQLAGDLLPNSTDEDLIATAFHRNTLSNDEGGSEDEEFRVAAVIDRVNTTWSGIQGITMECVQCHTHTYDPIRHEEFYRSYAYFNNTADGDLESDSPNLITFTSKENQEKLQNIKSWVLEHTTEKQSEAVDKYTKLVRLTEPKIHFHSFDQIKNGVSTNYKFLVMENRGQARLKNVPLRQSDQMLIRYRAPNSGGTVEIRLDKPEGKLIGTWYVRKNKRGYETIAIPLKPVRGNHDLFFLFKNSGKQGAVCIIQWVLFHKSLPGKGQPAYAKINEQFISLLNNNEDNEVPVLLELPGEYKRKTHVFERGNWMVHGEEVQPGVPEIMHPMPEDAPPNRLGFARWLTSKDNPLTARVMVNRLWVQLFGIGIIETQEDFGSQGSPPSHPKLLDWLARQFMYKHDWSVKEQLKQIVMSATYQQSSTTTPDLNAKDPDNRLLARGPRVRLSAEQVRDQGLAVGGLLSDKMYGPSVMPVQPEGLWQTVYSGMRWKTSSGEDKHRRALYTFWRRTNPYPSMISFDTPNKEVCVVRRINTNTPLQALVTLNDPVFIEMAEGLAKRMMKAGGQVDGQIRRGYWLALARDIGKDELETLRKVYYQGVHHFEENPEAALKLVDKKNIELASLTVVANVIMNLDEFVTKL